MLNERALKKKKGKYHHKNLRQALLQLTTKMIAEEGQDAVTLRELARRLNVSRTAPYRHFKDKGTLLAAVALECFTKLNLELLQDFNIATNGLQRLHRMMCHYITFAISHPEHYRLMFGDDLSKGSDYPELQSAADETFAIITQAISQCQEAGMLHNADPKDHAYVVWSTVHGLADLAMDGKLPIENMEQFSIFVCSTLIEGLRQR